MKYIVVIVLVGMLLALLIMTGCSNSNISTPVQRAGSIPIESISDSATVLSCMKVDGCEYIYWKWGNSTWGSHKGDCSNPIHKQIHDTIYIKK